MIEREIERVQGRVAGFEDEMASFFERLLAEDDPTHFATMAENLPEPPSFDDMPASTRSSSRPRSSTRRRSPSRSRPTRSPSTDAAEVERPPRPRPRGARPRPSPSRRGRREAEAEAVSRDRDRAELGEADAETVAAADGRSPSPCHDFPGGEVPEDFEVDREAAFAAIQAAAEAAASAEVATDAAARAEAVADIAIEIVGVARRRATARVTGARARRRTSRPPRPRRCHADATTASEIPEIGDDALAARLAGLVPGEAARRPRAETKSTQVIVVGLVSVASIASFKRHLGRLAGVQSVGVSSGPDGEFVFAVNHAADVVAPRRSSPPCRASRPASPARATASLNVTAHDPEADN